MKILLTGATGYIGKRLLPVLLKEGHTVVCCCRDAKRFNVPKAFQDQCEVLEIDFLKEPSLYKLPKDIDVAYYLIHSMSTSFKHFIEYEQRTVHHFLKLIEITNCEQIIYLSGIDHKTNLSRHLQSRRNVETTLSLSHIPLTTLKAGIIVGSGSSSFEIIRDLNEKLPLMIAPKWINTQCQPIAVRNVIDCLVGVLDKEEYFDQSFEIGGPEMLSYKEMLLQYAKIRNLKRLIISVPVLTPRLSSLWLYFVTSTNFKLAMSLVESMTIDVICKENNLMKELNIESISYKEAIERAFQRIEQNMVVSSWKDAYVSSDFNKNITESLIKVPQYGCFKDEQVIQINNNPNQVIQNIWSIGGKRGWYYGTFLWKLRGYLDKLVGGVGLRRGRTNNDSIANGDALDFWRVVYADKIDRRLLLFAEMKLPGEAWLEFKIKDNQLYQTATFRPKGIWGRLYWYTLLPFHWFIFSGMAKRVCTFEEKN